MSYDEGIRPSQQALAELFCDEVAQSYDTVLMDGLVGSIVSDYGETHNAVYAYETNDYPLLRQRDLYILREISNVLPSMRDPRLCGAALCSVISHMNTLEGKQALHDLVETTFHNDDMTTPLRDHLVTITDDFRSLWRSRFGEQPKIGPEEFDKAAHIPDQRPLPNISPDFMSRLGFK